MGGEPATCGTDGLAELTAVRWLPPGDDDRWGAEIRSDPFPRPQLERIRAALGWGPSESPAPPADESLHLIYDEAASQRGAVNGAPLGTRRGGFVIFAPVSPAVFVQA
jgi:hypothetical protein